MTILGVADVSVAAFSIKTSTAFSGVCGSCWLVGWDELEIIMGEVVVNSTLGLKIRHTPLVFVHRVCDFV